MLTKRYLSVFVATVLFLMMTKPPLAMDTADGTTIRVPVGTKVYCELQERVISKKKKNAEGSSVEARVWRDVIVDGRIVIPKGTSVEAKVDRVKSAKIAGISGKLEIGARYLILDDGQKVAMDGGLGKKGKGSVGAAVTLSLLVAWPLIFIPGGKVKLEPGTIFDAYTDETFEVDARPRSSDGGMSPSSADHPTFDVAVLYDEMNGKKKTKGLPMSATLCGRDLPSTLVIDRINGSKAKKPIPVQVKSHETAEACHECRLSVPMKRLSKQFRPGINYFDVAYRDGETRIEQEVVLDLQF